MLLFVPPERQRLLRERFRNLLEVPFRFEQSGSEIVWQTEENTYDEGEIRKVWVKPVGGEDAAH